MKKILLIDDNKDLRENTAEILELARYEVITAKDGKEGVELALKIIPDLIICDIMMPNLDGYGVIHLLSKDPRLSQIPFIFLTAKAERGEIRKGMEMGADDYLTKPFDDIELLNAIEIRLKKKQAISREFALNAEGVNEFLNVAGNFSELKGLSKDREVRHFRKKETIYEKDAPVKGVFFIVSGKVKTYQSNDQGKEFITGLYGENDFFGYSLLLERNRYTDTAAAISDAQIQFIPKEDFFELLFKNTQVSQAFIRMLARNIREREEQLVKLAYNSVRKRVAEAIITLYKRYSHENEEQFSIRISREDLAGIAGTATETTIRTLSDFKEEGLIETKGSTISVLNLEKLEQMKN